MQFDNLINSLLKEEELSKEDRIKALKNLSVKHTYTIDIYTENGERNYQVMGHNLYDALKELPEHAYNFLFRGISNIERFKDSEKDLLDFFNSDTTAYMSGEYIYIYEDGRLLCTSDETHHHLLGM